MLFASMVSWADVVYLKNGSVIKGKVIETAPNKSYKIKTKDGSIFVFEAEKVEKISFGEEEEVEIKYSEIKYRRKEKPNKISLGVGIPYGMLGWNLEIEKNRFAVSGGVGRDISGLMGWAVGVRAYLNEPTKTFRLRAGCFYGIVAGVWMESYTYYWGTGEHEHKEYKRNYPGFAPSLGFEWRYGENLSLEFDLLHPIFDKDKIKKDWEKEGWKAGEDAIFSIPISLSLARRW
ncbi:MAG: hypothetical protein V2A53_04205 [bacterium]